MGRHHPVQRLTLIYLATYLLIGGGGLLVAPMTAPYFKARDPL